MNIQARSNRALAQQINSAIIKCNIVSPPQFREQAASLLIAVPAVESFWARVVIQAKR